MKRSAASWAGLAVLAGALSPPVEAAVGRSLSAHMLQHLALLLVGPGLLALDRPFERVASLLPRARELLDTASDALRRPGMIGSVILVAAGFHAVVVSAWHAPAAYDAAVASAPLHIVEHATFIAAGWATWVAARTAATVEPGAAIAGLFLVAAQGAALGAILTFAGTPLYESTAADALADQQLAGLIMWVPGGAPYAAAAALVVARAAGLRRSAELAVVRR